MEATKTPRRIGSVAFRLFGVLALALLLTTALTAHAGAEANNGTSMDKGAFKTGCEAGGGSYIENNDGSFQCNLKDGGTIKCQNTTSPCTYTPMKIRGGKIIRPVIVGNLQAALNPAPTPVPTKVAVAKVSKVGAAVVGAP